MKFFYKIQSLSMKGKKRMRCGGIEPPSPAWQAGIIPLNQQRSWWVERQQRICAPRIALIQIVAYASFRKNTSPNK